MIEITAYKSNAGNIYECRSDAMMADLSEETKQTIEQIARDTDSGEVINMIDQFVRNVALRYIKTKDGSYSLHEFNPKKFSRHIRRLRNRFWRVKAQYDMEQALINAQQEQHRDEHEE